MKRNFIVQLALIILLANCSSPYIQKVPNHTQGPVLITPHSTPSIVDTLTLQITPTPTFKSKISYPTPTFTTSPPLTIPPESHLKIQCLNVSDGSWQDGVVTGTLVLYDYNRSNALLFDLNTGIKTEILKESGETLSLISVSPNRKWFANTKDNKNQGWVVISRQDGKPYKTVPLRKDLEASIIGWLDNEHLILAQHGDLFPTTDIILNPFTGKEKKLLNDYPNIETVPTGADWWGRAVYDPSLTRVVYPRTEGDETNAKRIVLWDLKKNQVITYLTSSGNPYGGPPVWTSDGQQFAMTLEEILGVNTLSDELFSITRDGRITQLTNLKAYYSVLMKVVDYSWSLDNQQIAFWIAYGWNNYLDKQQLAVLNLKTQEVTNYCVSGTSLFGSEPIWSPDGRYLVVEGYAGNNIDTRSVILIDLLNKKAIQIGGDNQKPLGWMISPQS